MPPDAARPCRPPDPPTRRRAACRPARVLWPAALLAAGLPVAQAQSVLGRGPYVPPPAHVEPVYTPAGPDLPAAPQAVGSPAWDLTLGYGFGHGGGSRGTAQPAPAHLHLQLAWRPFAHDRGWFVQGRAFQYLGPQDQRPWDPDFHYAFGHDSGLPGRWSFWYANFNGTRWFPQASSGESRFNFRQGVWVLRHLFDTPAAAARALRALDGATLACAIDLRYTQRYAAVDGALASDQVSSGLGCRVRGASGWFAHATAVAWPGRKQQPWNPDYIYGIGWTAGATGLTVEYANHSGNRWPGREAADTEGRLRDGQLLLSWTTRW